ncbi:class I SAM-dependent methyltransferase [Nitrospinae bacterium AH_259_B05_G02_I21]|nr:class I SAM-dependent methyltransferase [Nitrospinae bacterium AH_259_B05_G02_I21]
MTKPIYCPIDNESATFLFRKWSFSHYRCDTCGLRFVWPLPEPEIIRSVYGEGYRPDPHKPDYQAEGRAYAQTSRENLLIDLPNGFATSGLRLLDVGCGFGFFLEAVRQDFRHVCGVEISEPQRVLALETLGLKVPKGDATSIPFGDESVDVVTILDVLEHLPNPRAGLQEAKRVLTPGGLLVIATPNPESMTARILGQRWIYYTPPEHLHLFPPRSLVSFVEKEGFEVLRVRTESLLLHHLLEAWRGPKTERAAIRRSDARISRAIRRRRLLKAVKDTINAVLAHWHVGDKLRIIAQKRP